MTRVAHARIERAIREAEENTTGHIVVRVVPDRGLDAFARAREEFEQAGLHRHKERNVALVLVAPRARRYAVVGDRALHERVGDAFWQGLVAEMQPYFAGGKITDAVLYAVGRIGSELHTHFPAHA